MFPLTRTNARLIRLRNTMHEGCKDLKTMPNSAQTISATKSFFSHSSNEVALSIRTYSTVLYGSTQRHSIVFYGHVKEAKARRGLAQWRLFIDNYISNSTLSCKTSKCHNARAAHHEATYLLHNGWV